MTLQYFVSSALDQFYVYHLGFSLLGFPLNPQGLIASLIPNAVGIYSCLALIFILLPWLGGAFGRPVSVKGVGAPTPLILYDSVATFVALKVKGWTVLLYGVVAFILISNLLGNVPFGYTLTTSCSFVMGGNVALWVWLVLVGTTLFGTSFLGSFIPKGTPLALTPILAPIEMVSYSARAFSLGIRLFSNMLAGHTLLAILSGFILAGMESGLGVMILSCMASVAFSLLVVLEIAVSGIQSYVFGVLVGSYMEGTV